MTSEKSDKGKFADGWDHWEHLIETTPDPIAIVDAEFVVRHFNKPFGALVPGFKLGGRFRDIVLPEHQANWDACLRDSSGNRVLSAQVALRSDELARQVAVRVLPVLDGGEPSKFLVICIDVTDTMGFETELRTRDALLQKAERLGGLASWAWDVHRDRGYWSDNLYRMVGIEPQSLTPNHDLFMQVTHPEDREKVGRAHQAALKVDAAAGVKEYQTDFRLLKADGMYTTVHARVEVEYDSGGNATRMSGVLLDVTERLQIQEELRISKERWQFALENAEDGLWDWNPQTDEVFFSSRWKSMLGYEDHEIRPSGEEWSSRVHPDDLPQCYADLEKHFKGEAPSYHNEHRIRCKDGTYKWILARGKVVERKADGTPIRIVGTHTDMTEIRRMELALITANEKLAKEHQNLEDKNTALRVILSQIQDERDKIKEQIAQNLERIIKPSLMKLRASVGERGRTQIDALESALAEVTSPFVSEIEKQFVNLTPREMEVCNHIKNGFRSKEIADLLNISVQTVEKFRQKIRKKLKIDGSSANLSSFLRARHHREIPPEDPK